VTFRPARVPGTAKIVVRVFMKQISAIQNNKMDTGCLEDVEREFADVKMEMEEVGEEEEALT
jgi:hypothetical protein